MLVYLISFVVIGGAWGSHQRMVSYIGQGDGLLVWLNLLSLQRIGDALREAEAEHSVLERQTSGAPSSYRHCP